MMFYLLQMMIPGIFFLVKKKRFMDTLSVVALPFFFPFWIITKILLGEKKPIVSYQLLQKWMISPHGSVVAMSAWDSSSVSSRDQCISGG
jgi:hypothetical protein